MEIESSSFDFIQRKQAAWDGISLAHYHVGRGKIPEHLNQDHLIALSLSERCNSEIRTASGFRARDQKRGSICIVPSGQPFTVDFEAPSEHLAMFLDPALVSRAAAEANVPGRAEVIESCNPNDRVVQSVGLALLAELETENIGSRLYADSLANILALHLVRNYTGNETPQPRFVGGLSGKRLANVLAFVDENFAGDPSLAELAEVAGMSTFHFAREFKRATGTTPHQYLMKLRIDRAKELLMKSELPLVDVGFQSGFSHQSHFSRLFRKLTGTTPQTYRLRFQT
jgi:AraC family transcriptional regulator